MSIQIWDPKNILYTSRKLAIYSQAEVRLRPYFGSHRREFRENSYLGRRAYSLHRS